MRINKQLSFIIRCIKFNLAALILTAAVYALFSFKTVKFNDDVLSVIGLSPSQANEKISNSIIGGYINAWGIKNLRSIGSGNRTAVTMDLLDYTKKYLSSADFEREYAAAKENHKPQLSPAPDAPEQYRQKLIDQAKQVLIDAQKYYDNASAENKSLFKPALDDAKKYLEDTQNPGNELIKFYADNYSLTLDAYKKDSIEKLNQWEAQYPQNKILFVKTRLKEFMKVTADIDFNTATVEKNGKTYFVNQQYEAKDYKWKMAYRAGKEVVQTSRTFVEQWLNEIK